MKHCNQKSKNNRGYLGIKIVLSLLVTVIIYLIYAANLLSTANWSMQDMFFQQSKAPSEEIVVIGVTSQDLMDYGMWPWDRTIWARVLNAINSDVTTAPAAIGMTIPFYGSSQPVPDGLLSIEATKSNVILSCNAEFGTEIITVNNMDTPDSQLYVSEISFPYLYPDDRIQLGHTNIVSDSDGILRNGLLQIETPQNGVIPSMAYATFLAYNQYHNITSDFSPELDENGFWYVDYSTTTGGYFAYSVGEILRGDFDPDSLAGKMVLIGVYDPSLMDYYRPAIDYSEYMYGIEFMANCINAMMNHMEVQQVQEHTEVLVLLVSTFLITFLCLHLSFQLVSLLMVLFATAGLGIIYGTYINGILFPPFYFILGLGTCFLLAVGFNYWFEWYTKKHVQDVFSQYVDPKVMATLIDTNLDSLHMAGTSSKVAVLFVDLRGFTSLSEQLDPATVVSILNEFFTMVHSCIQGRDGTLDKFIGDCAMAFWGAPNEMEDPCHSACCCALEMVSGSVHLSQKILEEYGLQISFGVGVHYGPAIVGNVGSPSRLDYTAVGDTVNIASRLESMAPRGTVYVSQSIADALGDDAALEKLKDRLHLKGKKEPMDVYILQDVKRTTPSKHEVSK